MLLGLLVTCHLIVFLMMVVKVQSCTILKIKPGVLGRPFQGNSGIKVATTVLGGEIEIGKINPKDGKK